MLKMELDVVEKPMFGGLRFMVNGHMTVGIVRRDLMVRVGADGYDDALAKLALSGLRAFLRCLR